MKYARIRLAALLPAVVLGVAAAQAPAAPAWTGAGDYRILVRVDPVALDPCRTSDESVARLAVDFDALKQELGITGEIDLATLQVHKFDPATGQAETFPTFDNAVSPYDRPCRFDDDSIPQDYPDRANYPSNYADGRGPVDYRVRGGRLFNFLMSNHQGHIVWVHTQQGMNPSYYAIYWGTKGTLAETGPSPAPFIGDVDVLRVEDGAPLVGMAQLRICTGDLNGDGLTDIIAGDGKGNVLWCPNMGVLHYPAFPGCRPVMDESGPINVGYYAAPFVYDWNNDGLVDLLVGTSHNVILWWKNTGTPTTAAFVYQGFLQADGGRLETPETPCAEDPCQNIWTRDYCTMPCVCDWNNDGLPDILTGSYLTGQISYYRCTGRDAAGLPQLTFDSVLAADGTVLDTVWAASPLAYDVDNDGKLELITGNVNYGGTLDPADFLWYYRNVNTPASPVLEKRYFPRSGAFPRANMARAAVADWNADGRPDLVVSNGRGPIYRYLNIGTVSSPTWQIDSTQLTCKWGFQNGAFGSMMSMMDIDHDGHVEVLSGNRLLRVTGSPHSPHEQTLGTATVNGAPLWHPGPGYGDEYNYNILADWDLDGHVDILSGVHQGYIYFHRNLGPLDNLSYAEGIRFKLTSGEDLKVGPPVYDDPADVPDFQTLQGSRVKMIVADADGDAIDDLIVVETYGNIWVFRNTVAGATDKFEPGVLVGTGVSRFPVAPYDWNNDGKVDLICGLPVEDPGKIYLNQSTVGHPAFAAPINPLGLPFLFYNVAFQRLDWNQDGDQDFLIQGEYYRFWAEDSFLRHGYVAAVRLGTLNIVESGGFTQVNEQGPTSDTYTVALDQLPAGDVTVTITTDGQTTVEPHTLLFTPADWNLPRTVTVTAVDDDVYESYWPATHSSTITHSTSGGGYDADLAGTLHVIVIDNDRICGDPGTTYLAQDFNHDCQVNILDLARLAARWLICNDPRDPAACPGAAL